ncbi:MAG: AMP-binding protein, partial [Rhizobiaceae bacterium]
MLMREHVIGAAETPVPSLLVDSAARFPDRVARRFGDAALAYAEIADAALRVATALGAHGIGAGARVGLLLPNHPAFVATFYG